MKDKNLTIKELSQKSGVSLNTLYSITKRDSNMSRYDIVKKIASSLGISVEELTGYEIDESKTNIKNARLHEVIKRDNTQTTDINKILNKMAGSAQMEFHEFQVPLLAELLTEQDDKILHANALFEQLNEIGQEKAIEHLELLAKIPEYQKEPEEQPE